MGRVALFAAGFLTVAVTFVAMCCLYVGAQYVVSVVENEDFR